MVKVSVAVAAVCLCAILFGFYRRLEDLTWSNHYLQAAINQVQTGVNAQINSVSGRVEELLRAQNAVTADYGTTLVDWAVFTTTPGVMEEETSVLTREQWKALDGLREKNEDGSSICS